MHRDHYTQAIVVRRLFGSRVLLGVGEQESLDFIMRRRRQSVGGLRRAAAALRRARLVERMRQNWPEPDRGGEWEKPDAWLDGTEEIEVGARTLRAIPTPGHTRGHLVFADLGHGLLFAGDHVLPHITPSIGFEPARPRFRSGTTWARCAWSGRCPTCACCRPTVA